MPIAPLVAAFRRRLVNLPGPVRGSGEASNGEPVMVELLVGGEWVDLAAAGYVLVRDDSGQIRITYGIQGSEGSQTERATATLQLKNTDGRFSPRNPSGPYYDLLNWRNAQIRISVPDGLGGKSYRIWGEVSNWSTDWETSGNDVWVDVAVSGIMQRLAQGPAPERSTIYRAITDPNLTGLVAYWPCEDPSGSTSLASALTNGSPMTWTGNPTLAAYDGFGASDPLPTITGAALTGGVTRYDTSAVTQYQVRYLLAVPPAGFSNLDVISRVQVTPAVAGQVEYLEIHYNDPPGGVGSFGGRGTLSVQAYDTDGAALAYSGEESITLDVRGRLLRVSMEASNDGANQDVTLRVLDVETGVTDSATIETGANVTRVRSVAMGPAGIVNPSDGTGGCAGAAVGHITVQTTITDIEDLGEAIDPEGEAAGRRIQRLCGEEAVAFDWVGDLDDTVPLGPQAKQNLLTLVQEACLADGGLLYENRQVLGLGYRTRASLYNQDPALTLSYPGHNLAQVPVPVDDDRTTQNVLTVTVNGVSATYEETDGPLGTATIGKYGETSGLTLNLATTDTATLLDHAAWRVHLGTVDEARFPQISVNLAHSSITPDMRRAILGLRLGDRIQITDPPDWLPPDTIDQLILGMEETITRFEHRLSFVCAPASPYSSIGVLDAADARIDIDGSELLTAVSSSGTSLTVVPSAGESMLWTTDSADWPFDVRVGGEVMTVTSVTGVGEDSFTRTASSGWGTSDTGQAWSTTGGAAGDYEVTGGTGRHVCNSINTLRYTILPTATADADVTVQWTMSANPSGDSQYVFVFARYTDTDHFYFVRVQVTTANAMILTLRKRNGSETQLGSAVTTQFTHSAGTWYKTRFQLSGSSLKAKLWLLGTVEPNSWDITATDTDLSGTGSVGVRTLLGSASTAVLPVTIQFDNFEQQSPQTLTVTRSANGVIKEHSAGADIRLAYPTYVAL